MPRLDELDRSGADCACQIGTMSTAMLPAQEILRAVVADHSRREAERHEAISRIMADYREMPGMNVTLAQGCRLWSLSPELCGSILDQLIAQGYLKRRGNLYSCR